jgi:hypothetical protein
MKEWMDGKREACEALHAALEFMERKPEVKNNWEITGRRWLFLLSQKFGERVEAEAQAEVNKRLKEKGLGRWPVIK